MGCRTCPSSPNSKIYPSYVQRQRKVKTEEDRQAELEEWYALIGDEGIVQEINIAPPFHEEASSETLQRQAEEALEKIWGGDRSKMPGLQKEEAKDG